MTQKRRRLIVRDDGPEGDCGEDEEMSRREGEGLELDEPPISNAATTSTLLRNLKRFSRRRPHQAKCHRQEAAGRIAPSSDRSKSA